MLDRHALQDKARDDESGQLESWTAIIDHPNFIFLV